MANDLNKGFEKLIQDKFKDYRSPVDANNWDAIEKSLLRSKRLKYFYTTGIVAVAAILLLITLNLPRNDNPQNDIQPIVVSEDSTPATTQPDKQNTASDLDKQTETAKKTTQPEQQTPENQTKQEQPISNPPFVYSAAANAVQTDKPETHPEDPPVKNRLKVVPHTISGTSINLSQSSKLQLPKDMRLIETQGSKQVDKKNDKNVADDKKDMITNLAKNKQDNKKWSTIISFGAGNYQTPTTNNRNSELIMAAPLLTSSNSVNYIKNKYRNKINVPDNAASQHGLPLSAKFIVRKDINSRWAIESGLSYTYLSTKYKWNQNTVNQQLSYLGIPLNAVYYVVSKPGWNIYASAGGMVEKGIYAYVNRSDNLAITTKMNGLQWSINGAIGATYKLRRGLGLFLEPQFGYFFNNEQPENIRTEWPISFGLGVGLRIGL
jgi:hypothetical protein